MGWKTTRVVTTQVMDENPMTWLNAATTAFQQRNYAQGIEYADQALRLGENNQDIGVRAYAYKILLYYGLGDTSSARFYFQSKQNDAKFHAYLYDNCDVLVGYLKFDSNYWGDYWENIVRRKAQDKNVVFFRSYKRHIDDRMFASVCDNSFLLTIMNDFEEFVCESLSTLLRVNYPLSEVQDKDGQNLLHIASTQGNYGAAQILLENHINGVDSVTNVGITPLEQAICNEHVELAKLLIEYGADVNLLGGPYTPLAAAVSICSFDLVQFLLIRGANVNAYDQDGITALLFACLGDSQDCGIANLLISYGAEINLQYAFMKNRTILQEIAARKHWYSGNSAIWNLLLTYDVNIDAQDEDGMTALMLSLDHSWWFSDELDLPKALVARGASMDIRAKNGENAWDIIKRQNIQWK